MKHVLRAFLLVLVMAVCDNARASSDSLLRAGRRLLTLPHPTQAELQQACDLAKTLRYDYPDSILNWTQLLTKKTAEAGEKKLSIGCIYLQSIIYNIKGQFLLSSYWAKQGISQSREIRNDSLVAVGYNGLGQAQTQTSSFDEALQSFNEALKIRERLNDKKGIPSTLCSIGELYYEFGNFSKANYYIDLALKMDQNDAVLLNAYHTKANMLGMNGDFDKALELDQKGLRLAEKKKARYAYSMFYDNMANCYLSEGDFDKARLYFHRSLEVDSSLGNKKQMGDTYANLTSLEMMKKNYGAAKAFAQKSIALNEEAHSLMGIAKAYSSLRKVYEETKEYEPAYRLVLKESALRDSIQNGKIKNKLEEFNVLYENARKEGEISLLKKQQQINKLTLARQQLLIQKRDYQLLAIGGIIMLLAIVAYLLYNRQQLRQRQRNEKAILDAEYKERLRIARDVHDDLGAGLSQISLMAEVAKSRMTQDHDMGNTIGHIAGVSKELVDNMRDLVWVLNPEHTTPDNLIAHIREYIADYLEDLQVDAVFDLPEKSPDIKLPREVQRNLFLTVKEAVHNAVKHARATAIAVHIFYQGDDIHIHITDDGRGFAAAGINGSGNGLKNMRQRIESIGGSFALDSTPGAGTSIRISAPLSLAVADKGITL